MNQKSKICSTCKKEKSINEFCYRKNSKDGLDTQCRDCKNKYKRKYRKENIKKIIKYYKENKKEIQEKEKLRRLQYPWEIFYYRALTLCNNKKVVSYKHYGGKGIKCFLIKEDIEHLWFRDNAELMEHPQLRRKDKNKDYNIENCEFIEKIYFQLGKNNPIHKDWIKCQCAFCDKIIYKKPSILKHGRLQFCNNNCKTSFYSGENSHLYKDGCGGGKYPLEFNDNLKLKIRTRDNFTCQNCGMTEEEHLIVYGTVLHVHHINENKKDSRKENLITTCLSCNNRAKFNKNYWLEFYQNKIKEIYNLRETHVPSKILEDKK